MIVFKQNPAKHHLSAASGADQMVISGTLGRNLILGTAGDDTIDGGAGSVLIFAGAGNDTIYDNDNTPDTIFGGDGDDVWIPSTNQQNGGSDQVFLQDGDDTAYLGYLTSGLPETIDGGAGNDTSWFQVWNCDG